MHGTLYCGYGYIPLRFGRRGVGGGGGGGGVGGGGGTLLGEWEHNNNNNISWEMIVLQNH